MAIPTTRPSADVRSAAPFYHTDLHIRHHLVVADEPTDLGGNDDGPTPTELLVASLAACTSITVRAYARRKGWPLEAVDSEVVFERDAANEPLFRQTVSLRGNLTIEQRERLMIIAHQCPVHKLLAAPLNIVTAFTPVVI